jgi:hypothetical protein
MAKASAPFISSAGRDHVILSKQFMVIIGSPPHPTPTCLCTRLISVLLPPPLLQSVSVCKPRTALRCHHRNIAPDASVLVVHRV